MKPVMFGLLVLMMSVLALAEHFSSGVRIEKLAKREASDFASVEVRLKIDKEDLSQLRGDNAGLVSDMLSLKTDYAEVEKFRDALKSYMAARKDIGAFRELDDACGQLFMGLLSKEQELDKRLEKIEKRCGK